ncbi:MAG TPA: helix-turn-helix domain-containing protein [Rhizobiaceae bacterium]|nr:helix-turn-helix domain-containing protein [Rhizobiaceae bacterium]
MEICEGLIDIASALFNVGGKELRRTGRTSLCVSRVRQIAMYVGHVALGLSMNEIGRGFSRDRTTVLYACHLVEDMRDDDEFDRIVSIMEKVAVAAFRERGAV